jgi:hypothetical protein
MHELASLLHIESHRLERRIEHAGVDREQQPARLAVQRARQGGQIRIGRAVGPLPIEPERVLAQIDLADGVCAALILHGAAWRGLGHGVVAMGDKARCRCQKDSNRARFGHAAPLRVPNCRLKVGHAQ